MLKTKASHALLMNAFIMLTMEVLVAVLPLKTVRTARAKRREATTNPVEPISHSFLARGIERKARHRENEEKVTSLFLYYS